MRILTTRKFCFYSPDRKEKFITAGNRVIEDCPDWAKNDDTFKAGVRAGFVQCLMTQETKAEVAAQEAAPANAHDVQKDVEETESTSTQKGKKSKKKD